MASISVTSELMNNYVAAEVLPAAKHMVTCFDQESSLPLLFTLIETEGNSPTLSAVRTNEEGQKVLVDLIELFQLPVDSYIQTFDAKQADDGTIYLCIATKVDDRHSDIWVIHPFSSLVSISHKKFDAVRAGTARELRIGLPDAQRKGHPAVYVIHQPLDRTAQIDDISRLEVNQRERTCQLWKDISLPVNAKLLDFAVGSAGSLGEGLFYLTDQKGVRSLFAKFVRPGDMPEEAPKFSTYQLGCPEGACAIESFTDFDDVRKRSILVIGSSEGLHSIRVKDFVAGKGQPTLMSSKDIFQSPKSLILVQDKQELSIWAISQSLELSYLLTSSRELDDSRSSILLPAGQATVLSPMIYKPIKGANYRQTLIVNKNDKLILMQQSVDTGLWRTEPFFTAKHGSKVVELQTYSINIHAHDTKSNPVANGKVFIKPSSELPLIVNGRQTVLDAEGTWHDLDLSGEVALIIPTTGMTVQPLQVSRCRSGDGSELVIGGTSIDPSAKVLKHLETLSTPEGIENAKTKDGKSLWDGVEKPSRADMKCAASCFSALTKAHAELPSNGSKAIVEAMRVAKKIKMDTGNLVEDAGEIFMDSFHWVKEKAIDAVNWVIEKVGDVWRFACKIGGNIKNFVLDCIEKVKEAATWVWEKLKLGWNKLVEFVGFIFSWEDMLETKDTIKGLLNGGLDFAEAKIEGVNKHVDRLFDDMESSVVELVKMAVGEKSATGLRTTKKKDEEAKKNQEATSSTPVKWINERTKNDKAPGPQGTPAKKDNEAINLWEDRIKPLAQEFASVAEGLAKDISALFKDNHDLSPAEVLAQLGGNMITGILQVLRKLIKTIISALAKLVAGVKALANKKLEWGFLSGLYRWLTGSDLSIFDAISLLIAIPSTIVIKLVTGKKPPSLGKTSVDFYDSFVSQTVKKEKSSRKYKDTMIILAGCGVGAAVVKLGFDTTKLLYKLATQGLVKTVGGMSPGAIMEMIAMGLDIWTVLQDVMNPPGPDTPGATYRRIVTWFCSVRLSLQALNMVLCACGLENPITDQVMQCIELLITVANFGLNTAAALEEIDATSWKGYDVETTLIASGDNLVETVKGIGYFCAFTFKEKNPPVALGGVVCMSVAGTLAVGSKYLKYRKQYHRELKEV